MILKGVSGLASSIVSQQKKEVPIYCKSEIPQKDDTLDKFIKQKSDEAREVPPKERTFGNWAAIATDFVKNTMFNPVIMTKTQL